MPVAPSDSPRATTGSSERSRLPSQSSAAYRDTGISIFALLVAFRALNTLTLRTFFQPDEFFQSLEPAWQLAFGQESNAWLTWEWQTHLRSSLHPSMFAAVYLTTAKLAHACGLSLPSQAELLVAAPKLVQALFAALSDYFTWKLAERAYGRASRASFVALALSVCSPWQWFCSTRTLSNCLETAISSIAVHYWPWHWRGPAEDRSKKQVDNRQDILGSINQLRLALLLAAFACVLRPTNGLIWLAISIPAFWEASARQRYVLVREILICGSAVLACAVLCDRAYYEAWTFPPARFLYFNIAQSLAVFYGRNRPDYYFTEGLPLLLTTTLPFAVVGLYRALWGDSAIPLERQSVAETAKSSTSVAVPQNAALPSVDASHGITSRLAWACIIMTSCLSLISHKEVRFLYPILPFLNVISAQIVSSFFLTSDRTTSTAQATSSPVFNTSSLRRGTLFVLLATNVLIAGYVSQVHQRGVMDVMTYLRHKHEAKMARSSVPERAVTTVGFLMPCHSTPWRSHFIHPNITAWALTCEPPIDVPISERSTYLDEADRFYINPGPEDWLRKHMEHPIMVSAHGSRSGKHWTNLEPAKRSVGRRTWPHNLVFFEQLEPTMKDFLNGSRYKECWRGFNTHWHDDWRRQGDVIVWCLG